MNEELVACCKGKNKHLSQEIGKRFKTSHRRHRTKSRNYKKQKSRRNCFIRQDGQRYIKYCSLDYMSKDNIIMARLNSKRDRKEKTYAKNNWMSVDEYYHLEKPKISQKISNIKKIECDKDDKFLPTWKLILVTNKIVQLHLKLLIPSPPNYIIKNDSINVDCQLLGEKYTSIKMTIENEKQNKNIPAWLRMFGSPWKILHILCRFEFTKCINHRVNYDNCVTGKKLINNTYKRLRRKYDFENCTKSSEDNIFSYYMNQNEDDDNDDKDELKFKLTFKLHVPGIKRLITNYMNYHDSSIFPTIRWLNFHFGGIFRCNINKNYALNVFSRLIDNMDSDLRNKDFEIDYKCKNIFIGLNKLFIYFKRIDNIIIDMLQNEYNYGHFALIFMDFLYEYLALNPINEQTISYRKTQLNASSTTENIKRFFQNNINGINRQSMTVNKFLGLDINDWCSREWLIPDETEDDNCNYLSKFYFDTCNVSNTFDRYNILSNSWCDYSSYLNELISVLEQQQRIEKDNHVMHQRCMTNRQLLFNMLVLQAIKNEDKIYCDDQTGDDNDGVYGLDQNHDEQRHYIADYNYYERYHCDLRHCYDYYDYYCSSICSINTIYSRFGEWFTTRYDDKKRDQVKFSHERKRYYKFDKYDKKRKTKSKRKTKRQRRRKRNIRNKRKTQKKFKHKGKVQKRKKEQKKKTKKNKDAFYFDKCVRIREHVSDFFDV